MPENLDQVAATTPELIEIAVMRIAHQALLNRESQALHAATHVGVASGDPDPDAARDRDHRRLKKFKNPLLSFGLQYWLSYCLI